MDIRVTVEESLRQTIRKLEHDLRERNMELGCLYGFANVVDRSDSTMEEILQTIARLLPHAFQYPETACCRIVMGAQEFRTDNFRHTPFKLGTPIKVRGNNAGEVEILYIEVHPDCDEGPFLAEERSFIDMIAGRLGRLAEQKTTEDAIRKSEENYRSVFENAVEGMFQTTPDGFLLSANPAYAKMFGYSSPEEITGGSFNVGERVYADAADRVRFKRQINEHGLIQTFQFQALRKDGTPIWACLNARAVKDGKGRILYYEGTIEDITSLKQAEKEARDNAERYRRLFELESDAILLVDNETGRILEANNAAASIYGFSREEILGMRNEDLSAEPEETRRATQNELNVVPIRYHRKKDGTVFPVEITTTHLMWNGRRSHLAAIRDITERKRIEDALRRNEEEYRNIYDNAMVGIFQSLPEGRCLRVNNALASIHGFPSPEEMIAAVTNIGEQFYVNPKDRERYIDLLREDDMIRGFEAQLYRRDGSTVWISMNVKAVRNPNGSVAWYEGIVEDISERRQAEAALRESEERYRLLFDHSQDAIFLTRPDGSILDANDAACSMFGRSREEIIQVGRKGVVDETDPRLQTLLKERVIAGRVRGELTMVRSDAQKFPAEVTSAIFRDSEGLQKTSMIVRDMIEQKRAEEALEASERRYRTFLDSIRDLVSLKDEEMRYVFANKALLEYLGVTQEELAGADDFAVLPGGVALQARRTDEETLRTRAIVVNEETVGERTYETTKFPVPLTSGKTGIGTFVRDITERRRAEQELEYKEREIETLVNNTGDIIVRFDRNLRHVFVNRALSELAGIPANEYLGKTHEELGLPEDLCRFWQENLSRVFETNRPHTFEFRFTGGNGVERSLQANVSPEIDSDGVVRTAVSIARDVTCLKRMQSELERSQSELRRLAARLSEVEEAERRRIARSLHDDLGQHLTAIGINLNMMASILPKKTAAKVMPCIKDSLRLVRAAMNRVRHLISDLRNPILEDYGLLPALEWYCKGFVVRAGIKVTFSKNCFGGRFEPLKERELFRIAQESLTNVVRHARATEVRIALQKDNDTTIRLSIEDNGTGLPPEKGLDKENGPALQHWGLLMMRERAVSIGGSLHIESVPGKGTKVVTEVPE